MTRIRQFNAIVLALLAMTGRVTLLGISRWTPDGASYRTVQRFFGIVLPWPQLFWHFFRVHLFDQTDVYLLAGDETVVTKAGKHTHGLDRFFAGLYATTVPGLAFFTLSLISTKQRRSFPIALEQVLRSPEERKRSSSTKTTTVPEPKRKAGRPKGSTTTNKAAAELVPELRRIGQMITKLRTRSNQLFPLHYVLLDGHFGTSTALRMVRECQMQIISKLRFDSALYLPYRGPYAGRGPRRIYGERLDPHAPPEQFLCQRSTDHGIQTSIYQLTLHHKSFDCPLNVVVVVKTNQQTKRHGHVLLFSSDLTLVWDKLLDYYCLRFQLEFNFRDAKQYWGLEDWMNVKEVAVTNTANVSLFMVNVAERLVRDKRQEQPTYSVLDLKAECRGHRYVQEVIKLLPEKPEPILLQRILSKVAQLGCIHAPLLEPVSP